MTNHYPTQEKRLRQLESILDLPNNNIAEYLADQVAEGLQSRLGSHISKTTTNRLAYEMIRIGQHGEPLKLLALAKIAQEIKQLGVNFCGEWGNASYSLVCFCLGISNINPVEYDLPFDGFMKRHTYGFPMVEFAIGNICLDKLTEWWSTLFCEFDQSSFFEPHPFLGLSFVECPILDVIGEARKKIGQKGESIPELNEILNGYHREDFLLNMKYGVKNQIFMISDDDKRNMLDKINPKRLGHFITLCAMVDDSFKRKDPYNLIKNKPENIVLNADDIEKDALKSDVGLFWEDMFKSQTGGLADITELRQTWQSKAHAICLADLMCKAEWCRQNHEILFNSLWREHIRETEPPASDDKDQPTIAISTAHEPLFRHSNIAFYHYLDATCGSFLDTLARTIGIRDKGVHQKNSSAFMLDCPKHPSTNFPARVKACIEDAFTPGVIISESKWNSQISLTGNQYNNLLSLHSKSLLHFLGFVGVSEDNPIWKNIDGIECCFTRVYYNHKLPRPNSYDERKHYYVDVVLFDDINQIALLMNSYLYEYAITQQADYIYKENKEVIQLLLDRNRKILRPQFEYESNNWESISCSDVSHPYRGYSNQWNIFAKFLKNFFGAAADSTLVGYKIFMSEIIFDFTDTQVEFQGKEKLVEGAGLFKNLYRQVAEGLNELDKNVRVLPECLTYQTFFKESEHVLFKNVKTFYSL